MKNLEILLLAALAATGCSSGPAPIASTPAPLAEIGGGDDEMPVRTAKMPPTSIAELDQPVKKAPPPPPVEVLAAPDDVRIRCRGGTTEHRTVHTEPLDAQPGWYGPDATCREVSRTDTEKTIECVRIQRHMCGRAHAGVERPDDAIAPGIAAWLEHAQQSEAASVHAFRLLERELTALEAPADLLARVREAADDEARHARQVAALVRRFGGRIRPARRVPHAARSLRAIAVENAVEGCANETWSALIALHQAQHAEDAGLREAFASIARDEVRHAALAWDLHAWLRTRLSAADAQAVDAALHDALDALSSPPPVDPAVTAALGVPDAVAHRALADALVPRLAA
ncbi:MAG: ferritin-like domain-containing protein [Alphaproteobacteria bacterium]|nr:ferritin-like domain-containing protein [Alphaproteobacteria bacterium]